MKTSILFLIMCLGAGSHALTYANFKKRPKLILYLVVDQFRADQLTRLQDRFLPAGTEQKPGGYNFLLSKSAYYPTAEYKVFQAMTCPGHAMIASGAYPAVNGINLNDWYVAESKKVVGCVEDEKFGVSPKNLRTSTFTDELKTTFNKSRVFAVALKDRSAVMLGGHRSDLALWLQKSKGWASSDYYPNFKRSWLDQLNSGIKDGIQIDTPIGVEMTSQVAQLLLKNEKLGLGKDPDVLAISFSSHDLAGHTYGPFSPEVESIMLKEDQEFSKILKAVQTQLGSLKDVVVIVTGDHGIPPTVSDIKKSSPVATGKVDILGLYKKMYKHLDEKFGAPKNQWISISRYLGYHINPDALAERKVSSESVQIEMKKILLSEAGVTDVFTRAEFAKGLTIHPFFKNKIMNQYIPEKNGDVVVIPDPFFTDKGPDFVTHITGYSYDRYVPLLIFGAVVKPGVYSQEAEIIDIAPTLSFISGVLPPAKSSGRVLSEIFQ